MHELSIVMSIIDIAQQEAAKEHATAVEEIELDIGTLSGIEMDALDFAWEQAVKETILRGAVKKINRIEGKAKCMDCNIVFPVENYYHGCPVCGEHLLEIIHGKELKVKSLVLS